MAKKKVLLMGKAHSGKTSMRSIIFANYLARDTTRLSPTLDVEHHHVRFLGDLVLNLWDCGGQDAFYESYFERDRETIFRSVELLIYVFDIESDQPEKDFDHFCGVLEAMEENSPDAQIFILVHKMDLVAADDRMAIFQDRKQLIEQSCVSCGVENFHCFGTSIWDETLYKAWSEIVTNLIPNIRLLETHLDKFCQICDADEVVLFERATFLVISHAQATIGATTTATTALPSASSATHPTITNNNEVSVGTPTGKKKMVATIKADPNPSTTANANANANATGTATTTTSSMNGEEAMMDTEDKDISSTSPHPATNIVTTSNTTTPSKNITTNTDTDPTTDQVSEVGVGVGVGASGLTSTSTQPENMLGPSGDDLPLEVIGGGGGGTAVAAAAADGGGGDATTEQESLRKRSNNNKNNMVIGYDDNNADYQSMTPHHVARTPHFDPHRFEKISNIVKQFKLSCGKAQSQFQGMQVRNSRFSAFIDAFTANTYIMVIVSNPQVHTAATLLNIQNARDHFEKFIPRI